MTHEFRLTVRGYELDSFGHVNNAVYLNYMEQARWELLKDSGLYERLMTGGFLFAVTEAAIRYSREAVVYDELIVRTDIQRSPPYLIFTHVITRSGDGTLIARGTITTVLLDRERIPHDIPEQFLPEGTRR